MIPSYPKVYNLGHHAIADLLREGVVVQEKVDGSQFSFGHINGELEMRTRGAKVDIDAPPKMFAKAVEYVKSISGTLRINWIYRCEYLEKPKHNTLAYNRVPLNNLVLFDVDAGDQAYVASDIVKAEAVRLQIEPIPEFYIGRLEDIDRLKTWLQAESFLGGQKVEGVAIKNYNRYGVDGKCLMGKFVSEAFKEKHSGDWKARHPAHRDILQVIGEKLRTPARWEKAVQHLRDAGTLLEEPKDIGALMKEVSVDVLTEEGDAIKTELMSWAWKSISKHITLGLPQWYKEKLAEKQFHPVSTVTEQYIDDHIELAKEELRDEAEALVRPRPDSA